MYLAKQDEYTVSASLLSVIYIVVIGWELKRF